MPMNAIAPLASDAGLLATNGQSHGHAHGKTSSAADPKADALAGSAMVVPSGTQFEQGTRQQAAQVRCWFALICRFLCGCCCVGSHVHLPSVRIQAFIFFVALSLHSVFDGLSIGGERSSAGLYSMIIAVLGHKVVRVLWMLLLRAKRALALNRGGLQALDGFALGVPVYFARWSRRKTLAALVFCALMTPIGIGIGQGVTEALSGQKALLARAFVLALSAGSFLFISLIELLPAGLANGKHLNLKLLMVFLGWGIMCLLGTHPRPCCLLPAVRCSMLTSLVAWSLASQRSGTTTSTRTVSMSTTTTTTSDRGASPPLVAASAAATQRLLRPRCVCRRHASFDLPLRLLTSVAE
jgi:zinc transporter ZupT